MALFCCWVFGVVLVFLGGVLGCSLCCFVCFLFLTDWLGLTPKPQKVPYLNKGSVQIFLERVK